MKHTFRLFTLAVMLVLLVTLVGKPTSPAYAAYTTVNSISQGWIHGSGYQIPGNTNYLVGYRGNNYRDFFVFDLSNVSGNIIGAALRINVSGYSSLDPSETVDFYDVSTPASALMDGTGGADAYIDLGTGTLYGSVTITGAEGYQTIDIPLNESAAAAINSALGGYFSIGGALITYGDNNEYVFGDSMQYVVQLVLITDTVPPSVTVPQDMVLEAQNSSGATVDYTAYATDETGPLNPAVTCNPAAGSLIALDSIVEVTCSATDNAGNVGYGYFQVQVVDTTPAMIVVPSDITVNAAGPSGTAVSYNVSAVDLVDGALTPSCDWPSGATFPIGTTLVTCSVVDAHGNRGTNSFNVTVLEDLTPPELSLEINNPYEATGPSGAIVNYNASFTDSGSGLASASCAPASGSIFPIGTTTVNCTATDNAGNTATPSFDVVVQDTTAPVLNLPADMIVSQTTPGGSVVTFEATATDLVSANPAVTCVPPSGSTFAVGTTVVSCSATDDYGNTASGSFNITVGESLSATFLSVGKYDGTMKETKENSNTGSTPNVSGSYLDVGDASNDAQVLSFLHFDTSSLPDNAVITGLTIRIKQYSFSGPNPIGPFGNLQLDIVMPFFGAELTLKGTDFLAPASATNVGMIGPNLGANGWYESVLQSAAFPFINTVGGTQFRLYFPLDDNDNMRNNLIRFYSGNAAAANRPMLIVEYFVPAP